MLQDRIHLNLMELNLSFDVGFAGGDGNLPPRFQRVRAPLAPTETPKL